MLPWAPGHVLAWARDALRWSPNHGHAWDLRGRALHRLGHPDIAQAVYWKAVRCLPEDAVVRNQLARLLLPDQARMPEAEALFREAQVRDPDDAVTRVELARLLARTGRESGAEELLRRTLTVYLPDNPITPYILALLLIAWNRPEEAAEIATHYARAFGEDKRGTTLQCLLNAGAAGIAEVQRHLADQDPHLEPDGRPIASDAEATPGIAEARPYPAYHDPHPEPDGHPIESAAETARREAALKGERRSAPFLRRAAAAGRADILFRVRDTVTAERILDELLKDDPGNLYPQVVWALHTPAHRAALAARYRETLGALAPHLAATGPTQTSVAHWERLYDEFPERRGLIDFTRLMRTGPAASITSAAGGLDHRRQR